MPRKQCCPPAARYQTLHNAMAMFVSSALFVPMPTHRLPQISFGIAVAVLLAIAFFAVSRGGALAWFGVVLARAVLLKMLLQPVCW